MATCDVRGCKCRLFSAFAASPVSLAAILGWTIIKEGKIPEQQFQVW